MGESTIEVTSDNFKDTIENNDIVLVDYWAEWCGPCRAFGPIFERAATENPDIAFGKCDTEKELELASTFQISSIPTLMVFKEGVLIFSQPGMLPAPALSELIGKIRELDMDEVRQKIAEERREKDDSASSISN
jgi:thioredoxin 1